MKIVVISFITLLIAVGVFLYIKLYNPFVYIPLLARETPAQLNPSSKAFNERITRAYPIGMPEAELIKALQAERMKITNNANKPYTKSAWYSYSRFPCAYVITIQWDTDNGHIRIINGQYRASCL